MDDKCKIKFLIDDDKMLEMHRRVYDTEHISPLVHTAQDGGQEIKIAEATKQGYAIATGGDSVNLTFPGSKTRRGRVGKQIAQTLDTQCNQGVVVATESIPQTAGGDGVIAEPKTATVVGGVGEKKSNGGTQFYQQDRVYEGDVALAHPANISCGSYAYKVDYRIRRLTPKECWRLMGFDDADYEAAEKVCSNSRLYAQAGNSIVVQVLENIFKEMF